MEKAPEWKLVEVSKDVHQRLRTTSVLADVLMREFASRLLRRALTDRELVARVITELRSQEAKAPQLTIRYDFAALRPGAQVDRRELAEILATLEDRRRPIHIHGHSVDHRFVWSEMHRSGLEPPPLATLRVAGRRALAWKFGPDADGVYSLVTAGTPLLGRAGRLRYRSGRTVRTLTGFVVGPLTIARQRYIGMGQEVIDEKIFRWRAVPVERLVR